MYTQKKTIENTHIVRERDRRRFRELLAVFSLGIPIGLFLLLFTWQNLEVIRLGSEATRLQKTQKDLEAENKSLQLELDRLTALEAVEKKASDLGFERTQPAAIVMVSGNTQPTTTDVGQALSLSGRPAGRPAGGGQAGELVLHPAGAR